MGENKVKLVDTSAWIEYLRSGYGEVADKVESLLLSGNAEWCDMVMLELWNGARGSGEKRKLAELAVASSRLEIDAEVWKVAHRLATICRDHGKTIPATDILIAPCAAYHEVEVEHCDKNFHEMLPLSKS